MVSGAKASETLTMIIHKRNDLLRFLGLLLMYIKNYTYNPIISNFSFLSEGKENLKTSHSSDYLWKGFNPRKREKFMHHLIITHNSMNPQTKINHWLKMYCNYRMERVCFVNRLRLMNSFFFKRKAFPARLRGSTRSINSKTLPIGSKVKAVIWYFRLV